MKNDQSKTDQQRTNSIKKNVTTRVGSLEGFPYSSFGRYSAIALVTTRARRYSTTPILSTAPSLPSKCLMTDSGLAKNEKHKRNFDAN